MSSAITRSETAERISRLRKQNGLTYEAMAETVGVSKRTYARIEKGLVNLRVETLERICDVLSVTPNDLLLSFPDDLCAESLHERFLTLNESNRLIFGHTISAFLYFAERTESDRF